MGLQNLIKKNKKSISKRRSDQKNFFIKFLCERFHQTVLNEFYRVAFRKKLYGDLENLQADLDRYLDEYNNERTHQGKRCIGRTPMETFIEGKQLYNEKNLERKMAA